MVVCHCRAVNDRLIRAEIESGALSCDQVADRCGAGSDCGSCQPLIEALIAQFELVSVRAS
ncbi:MAG: (2Fe-2S)-binding protein [Acidimicrobiales bacterium]